MLQGWVILVSAFAYILLLFAVASYGDRKSRLWSEPLGLDHRNNAN
ncbi:Na+/proline symporter [Rhizobium cellulosilyticum]|uniref:Na+/proline symporter n=1 Tax=Aliirhizobium cellulosilyticum TaxID=393664 RepID=A0A7W6V3V6_9HYPH|nr:Na+/proline symporter [Rhizobium cellulosilyticum]MBB4449415.1 Na+/proline symporter [Rhizobium cellulosilyticum]